MHNRFSLYEPGARAFMTPSSLSFESRRFRALAGLVGSEEMSNERSAHVNASSPLALYQHHSTCSPQSSPISARCECNNVLHVSFSEGIDCATGCRIHPKVAKLGFIILKYPVTRKLNGFRRKFQRHCVHLTEKFLLLSRRPAQLPQNGRHDGTLMQVLQSCYLQSFRVALHFNMKSGHASSVFCAIGYICSSSNPAISGYGKAFGDQPIVVAGLGAARTGLNSGHGRIRRCQSWSDAVKASWLFNKSSIGTILGKVAYTVAASIEALLIQFQNIWRLYRLISSSASSQKQFFLPLSDLESSYQLVMDEVDAFKIQCRFTRTVANVVNSSK